MPIFAAVQNQETTRMNEAIRVIPPSTGGAGMSLIHQREIDVGCGEGARQSSLKVAMRTHVYHIQPSRVTVDSRRSETYDDAFVLK
jgi:hypothetical protein